MKTAWHGAKLLLPLSFLFGAAYANGQDAVPRSAQVAALHPLPGLVWRRTSPTLGKPDGPVLYQLIFRSNATPNSIPMISPQFTLTNSPIQVNGSGDVVIGGLTINGTTGMVTFASGQQLNSGGPFVDLSSDQTIAGIKTFSSAINGNIAGSAGMLGGELPSFYQARVAGNCTAGSAVLAVNADGSVLCAGPFFDLSSDQTISGIKTFSQLIQGSVSGSAALLGGEPPSFYQTVVTGSCPAGAIQGINANGSVVCSGASVDLTSNQTIVGVKTFSNVINGSISGSAAMLGGQPASFYQAKVTGSCPLGSAVIAVNGDGSVACGPATNLFASTSNLLTLLDGNARQASNAITIGADGMPIIVYNGTFDVNNVLQPNLSLVHCASVDCSTHGNPVVIDGSTSAGLGASVTIGRDGFPVVSGVLFGGLATVYVIHCTAIDCSSFSPRMVLDTQAASNGETSIIIGRDGFPIVSYGGVMTMHSDLSVVHCTAMDCSTFDAPLVLEAPLTGGSYGGLYSSIGIGTDGFPIIAYSSGQGPNPSQTALATIHCATANCSSHDSPVLLDVCGQCGSYASLITGADGLPAIAYQGIFSSATVPKFVHCGSLDCSAHGAPALLDNRGGNPLGTSITVGGDGMPIVSYDQGVNGDGSSGDLAFVHCNSLDCALKESPVLLAKNFAAGPGTELTSVTVGNDGEPIVSYVFFGPLNDSGLKVAHCANVLCAPPLVRRR